MISALRLLLPLALLLVGPPLLCQQAESAGPRSAPEVLHEPPRLCGILDLDSLALLEAGFAAEPLDIAAAAEGPVLLFADRYLSLGANLEVDRRTIRDLALVPPLPAGFIPSRLLLNPLGEPLLLSAGGGQLLLVPGGAGPAHSFRTDEINPLAAAALARGGLALLGSQQLSLYTRSGQALQRTVLSPGPGFYTALDADSQDRLWAYDVAAREVRLFDREGKTLGTIRPQPTGEDTAVLLFPQLLRTRPDGSFFLGGSGELWCFEPDGAPRWRLDQFSARYRQSLPAFFLVAVSCLPEDRSFYLLDPLARRVLKFSEGGPSGQQAAAIDRALSEALSRQPGPDGDLGHLLSFCLERGLLLQADSLSRLYGRGRMDKELGLAMMEKRARLAGELALDLEAELRFPEAQEAYNHGLNLYRELRRRDPVDSLYPEAIRTLVERRNTVRDTLLLEPLLDLEPAGEQTGSSVSASPAQGSRGLSLAFVNSSAAGLEQLEVEARFSGLAESRWTGSIRKLEPGATLALSLPFTGSGPANAEDLLLTLNMVVTFLHQRGPRAEYFRRSFLLPAGALRLPSPPCALPGGFGTSQH